MQRTLSATAIAVVIAASVVTAQRGTPPPQGPTPHLPDGTVDPMADLYQPAAPDAISWGS